jgi:hypothetical protein
VKEFGRQGLPPERNRTSRGRSRYITYCSNARNSAETLVFCPVVQSCRPAGIDDLLSLPRAGDGFATGFKQVMPLARQTCAALNAVRRAMYCLILIRYRKMPHQVLDGIIAHPQLPLQAGSHSHFGS